MRHTLYFLSILFLAGCAGTKYSAMTEDYRQALGPEDLAKMNFYLNTRVDFVSLKKGEIVGTDIFKREVKRTITIEPDSPGRLVTAGQGWMNVEFDGGVLLTFRWDPVSEKYLTPGWGTVTIQNERFDIKQGVLSGGYLELLVLKNK